MRKKIVIGIILVLWALISNYPAFCESILIGGYWDTRLYSDGGYLKILALSNQNLPYLELYYNGISTGIFLRDDGLNGDFNPSDGIYGFTANIPKTEFIGKIQLEVGSPSFYDEKKLWPYLNVASTSHSTTPTPIPPPWPEWVYRHWVWENEGTTQSTKEFIQGFLDHDIVVGGNIIDAPWETCYNSFDWDENRYPEPQELINWLHSKNIRVFIWITPNINSDCPEVYKYAKERGYLLNDGKTIEWWHGDGAFIDYSNPEAVEWWHSLMDKVLDMGIDGWKCDGSDPMILLLGVPQGKAGIINPRDYSNWYYRDFFYYTRQRLGEDRVITSRPVDCYEGIACYTFSPRDVCHAAWVGDQDPTWHGLELALTNIFFSANLNYVNMGSDIGGFRSGDSTRTKSLFLRWAQVGAFCPIMENGGNGEHRPWKYDNETLEIYRNFVNIHHSLTPYLHSQGAISYYSNKPLIRPYNFRLKSYFLGDYLYVSPVLADVLDQIVVFPSGTFIDFFTEKVYSEAGTKTILVPLSSFPVFVKEGAIIPTYEYLDQTFTNNALDILIYPAGLNEFIMYEEGGPGINISYQLSDKLNIKLTPTKRKLKFSIHIAAILNRATPEQAQNIISKLQYFVITNPGWSWDGVKYILKSPYYQPLNGLSITIPLSNLK